MFIVLIINCFIYMYGIIVFLYDYFKLLYVLLIIIKYNFVVDFVLVLEFIVRS